MAKKDVLVISRKLKYYLKQKNLSVYALAKILGIRHQAAYRIVNGQNKKTVKDQTLQAYANALDVTIEDLKTPLPKRTRKRKNE